MRSKKQKWMIRSVVAFILIGIILILYINNIRATFDKETAAAIRKAKKQADIKQVERVALSALEEKSIVVIGKDKHGQRILCWITDGSLDWQYESDGTSEQQIRNTLTRSIPNLHIKHVNPIMFQGGFAWEAYIDFKQGDTKRTQYVYFDFLTGKKLQTYTMHP